MKNKIILAVCALTVTVGLIYAAHGHPSERDCRIETVTVRPGQTLWDIATDNSPDGMSKQRYIFEIKKLNGRTSSDLYAGERIKIMIYERN